MNETFHIKNFDRLQHYKDRSPPWIKLYNGLLDDYEFARLPDASKAHLLAIGLLASRYSNKIPLDAEWISRRINATEPIDLVGLVKSGFIIPDQDCSKVLAECYQNARPEREGETQVQGEKETESIETAKAVSPSKPPKGDFEAFWIQCPRKVGKGSARKAYLKAVLKTAPATLEAAIARYALTRANEPEEFTVHPATWLNQERWLDELKANGNGVDHLAAYNTPEEIEAQRIAREKAYGSQQD